MAQNIPEQRLKDLIEQANKLKFGGERGVCRDGQHSAECVGWLTAAVNLIGLLSKTHKSIYLTRAEIALNDGQQRPVLANERVAEV